MTEKTPLQQAVKKLQDYLARRNHSLLELKTKLSKNFEEDTVDQALALAADNRWLLDEQELAQQVAESLHRRLKGKRAIQAYLRRKGLPLVDFEEDLEIEKAQKLLEKFLGNHGDLTRQLWPKAARHLQSRGFEDFVALKVLKEKSP